MLQIDMIKTVGIKALSVAKVYGRKYAPEALIGTGLVSGAAAIVTAVQATPKAKEVISEIKEDFLTVEEAEKIGEKEPERYSETDARKDKTLIAIQGGLKLAKVYWPTVVLETLSVTCILGGFGILKRRSAAVAAAYAGLKKVADMRKDLIDGYRDRIKEELGEDKLTEIDDAVKDRIGKKRSELTEKRRREEPTAYEAERYDLSENARCFNEDNSHFWKQNSEYNLAFLRSTQAQANDMLRARGHIFLNEVYDMLGFERTPQGNLVGWVEDGSGDGFVDFGFMDYSNPNTRAFLDGHSYDIWLDFNVDGVVFDRI